MSQQGNTTADFFAFLDLSPDALLVINASGEIVVANAQVEDIFGYARVDLLGESLEILLPERYRTAHAGHRARYFAVPRMRPMGIGLSLLGLRKNGQEFPVDISLRPLDLAGVPHAIGAVRDMSAQRSAEQQVVILREQQERYDTFLSMASHELRTPLATIQVLTQLLYRMVEHGVGKTEEQQGRVETARELLDEMLRQLKRLNHLIEDLLDVSRVGAHQLSFELAPLALGALIAETVATMQKTMSTHTLTVTGAEQEIMVLADRNRIEQVLINLLSNAIKYSPEATVVEVSVTQDNHEALVRVRDHGIGIAEEHQAHLFERYYRLVDAEHKKYAGLGIGLYITSEIIKRHTGSIWVESSARHGATFSFTLPLDIQERGK